MKLKNFLKSCQKLRIKPNFTLKQAYETGLHIKVDIFLKGGLDSIPSPLSSVKIQIMGGKVCLRCKGKTLLGVVNNILKTKSLLTSPNNVLPCCLNSPTMIWIFTEDKGDGIESRLSS